MMTIAPELPECLNLIQSLVNSNTIASFGHSSATYEETLEGFDAGISHVTHTFNAMPSLHHRSPGPLSSLTTIISGSPPRLARKTTAGGLPTGATHPSNRPLPSSANGFPLI